MRSINTGGTTNISDGLEQAFRQLSLELFLSHHVKIILLSDGEANNGITDIDDLCTVVSRYRNDGASISTIGVGIDYNSFFMESIATSSGALFYHLDYMSKLEQILTQELETLAALTMKQAKLSIVLPKGMQREKNLNDYSEAASGTVYLGNVFEDQEILFECFTDEEGAASGIKNVEVILEFQDYKGTKHKNTIIISIPLVGEEDMDNVVIDEKVIESVKTLMQSKAKREAIRHFEDRNFEAIQSMDSSSFDKLSNNYSMDVRDSLMEVKELQSSLSYDITEEKRSQIKEEYAVNLQRSRRKR
ncbi:hypothetical protein CVD28_26190 [Bacillus sp. M6-12]|nr:hypothetical protein CVD28_26190 [Bacillus sp. M6-12]